MTTLATAMLDWVAGMTLERSPRVTIDRRTAEILSDAAHAQACELRRLAEDCTPGDRDAILAEADEIDAARAAIDAALGRSP